MLYTQSSSGTSVAFNQARLRRSGEGGIVQTMCFQTSWRYHSVSPIWRGVTGLERCSRSIIINVFLWVTVTPFPVEKKEEYLPGAANMVGSSTDSFLAASSRARQSVQRIVMRVKGASLPASHPFPLIAARLLPSISTRLRLSVPPTPYQSFRRDLQLSPRIGF